MAVPPDKRVQEMLKLAKLLKKIPLFSDIDSSSVMQLLSMCTKRSIEEGDYLCRTSEPSDILYVLLFGKLAVKVSDSAPVAIIDPVSTIGEMGVFTGEPRTADVVAMEKSGLLTILKSDIDKFIDQKPRAGVSIMSKVIKTLAERISADNSKINLIQHYLISLEEHGQ